MLKENGYRTIHCGKAHFGARTTPGADPINMGFDVNIAGGANGAPGSYLGTKNFGEGFRFVVQGLEKYYGQDIFITEALTREAITEMEKSVKMDKPFYLYMSHYAVHTPYDDDKRFSQKYRGRYDEQLKTGLNENEAKYAALVEGMDKSLGDILDYLQKNPEVAQNTILLFMSDNGGQGLNNVRQGVANRDQDYPARGGKGSAFMGGVREPMMVYWPGVTKPNTECGQRVIIEDFYPTILDMAGVKKYTTHQVIDGVSFADVLKWCRCKILMPDNVSSWMSVLLVRPSSYKYLPMQRLAFPHMRASEPSALNIRILKSAWSEGQIRTSPSEPIPVW